ncbi:MAG TPA: DUF1653 domain-containing protein [Candidatus Saccharimonadales bacterium]
MKNTDQAPEIEKGTYHHYKGGVYEVLEVACHTETLEWHVVYRSNERMAQGLPSIWIRPYGMFIETVEVNGEVVPRFEKVD